MKMSMDMVTLVYNRLSLMVQRNKYTIIPSSFSWSSVFIVLPASVCWIYQNIHMLNHRLPIGCKSVITMTSAFFLFYS